MENKKCLGVLSGHTGSVKSLSCHSSNPGWCYVGKQKINSSYICACKICQELVFKNLFTAELIVTGSRDGSFALWDLRIDPKTPNGHREACLMYVALAVAI